jgi:hypothetical protein
MWFNTKGFCSTFFSFSLKLLLVILFTHSSSSIYFELRGISHRLYAVALSPTNWRDHRFQA